VKAIQYNEYAGLGGMALAEIPIPSIAADEVLVRVIAAGVNPVDIAVSAGVLQQFLPLVLPVVAGSEIAGVIEQVGADVQDCAIGDAVHAATGISGAFADYCAIKAANVVAKPVSLSFAEAAALPIAAATATAALNATAVGVNTRIVIHAASGGVGSVAVQMAKARGAYVIALASPANIDFVRSLGADEAVDRTSAYEDVIRDVDVVLDAYGPEAQARSWGLLRKGGILASLVTQPSEEEAARHGVQVQRIFGTPTAQVLVDADALVDKGQLRLTIHNIYPLADAVAALQEVESGRVRGKVILQISPDGEQ